MLSNCRVAFGRSLGCRSRTSKIPVEQRHLSLFVASEEMAEVAAELVILW